MKKVKIISGISLLSVMFIMVSFKDAKKEDMKDSAKHLEMHHKETGRFNDMVNSNMQKPDAQQVIKEYMALKEALVTTNKDKAAKAGRQLEETLKSFDLSSYTPEQQKELKDIISDAKEHAEHIGKSEIDHQREHFKTLSEDIIDMVAITGTKTILYQQFCPMYDGGSAWLSMSKDIKNPFYGSKMLACGKVQKEIK